MDKMLEIGKAMTLHARCEVTDMHESASDDKETQRSLSLQITDMELAPEQEKKKTEETLYGG